MSTEESANPKFPAWNCASANANDALFSTSPIKVLFYQRHENSNTKHAFTHLDNLTQNSTETKCECICLLLEQAVTLLGTFESNFHLRLCPKSNIKIHGYETTRAIHPRGEHINLVALARHVDFLLLEGLQK